MTTNMATLATYTRHVSVLVNVLRHLYGDGLHRGVEVGVEEGHASGALLSEFPRLVLTSVDAWDLAHKWVNRTKPKPTQARVDSEYEAACSALARFGSRSEILRMDSLTAVQRFDDESLDFAFIDANHSYRAVKADLQAWHPKVRYGGAIVCHDYGPRRQHRGVTRAFDEFCDSQSWQPPIQLNWLIAYALRLDGGKVAA
jgi:hypothetical protein